MTRKSITLVVVLLAVALLTGGYFGAKAWIKAHPKASPYASFTGPESVRLTDFDSSKLSTIEIFGPDSELRLEKRDGSWKLIRSGPGNIRIDQQAVSGKLWSISSLWAEQVVSEAPSDLGEFGLDSPGNRVILADSEGKEVELLFGNQTPSLSSYYVMIPGDPKVYTVSDYSAGNFLFTLDDIRDKTLITEFDPAAVRHFVRESNGVLLDITPRTEDQYTVSSFSSLVINSPYILKRGVDSSKFEPVLQALQGFTIERFVDDNPSSLAPYGLDKPGRIYLETDTVKLELLFALGGDGQFYAKLPGEPGVFTVTGLDTVANTRVFDIADKFALIFHIDNVETYTVTGEGRVLKADIRGTKDEPEFFLNGKKTEDKAFRTYYQAVIGLLADAEYPGPSGAAAEGSPVEVEFHLKDPPGAGASMRLVPYNRDFYSLNYG
ncbi:MAG: DUF4340 domain-containing protein, partial [Treponema sp.]|nr:DUF4340 domain-containing protein [Treponema sp.]